MNEWIIEWISVTLKTRETAFIKCEKSMKSKYMQYRGDKLQKSETHSQLIN